MPLQPLQQSACRKCTRLYVKFVKKKTVDRQTNCLFYQIFGLPTTGMCLESFKILLNSGNVSTPPNTKMFTGYIRNTYLHKRE